MGWPQRLRGALVNFYLNVSQQHTAIILKTIKREECTNKNKHAKTLQKLSQWAWVRHLLEYYIQFNIQKLKKDKETWRGIRENQQKRLKVQVKRVYEELDFIK